MATIIDMPKLSDTMTVGTLVNWLKKEGDSVSPGDMIAEVETDKATMELENFDEGILLKQYVKVGEQVPIGAPIAAIGKKGETVPETPVFQAKKTSKAEEKKEEPKTTIAVEMASDSDIGFISTTNNGRIKASPLARKIAASRGIALQGLQGTGPEGRIVKADVLAVAEKGLMKVTEFTSIAKDETIAISNMRRTIAAHLIHSKTHIPHFYLNIEVDAGPLMELRAVLNKNLNSTNVLEKSSLKLTVNDFILKATVGALRKVPKVNSSWLGESIRQHGSINLAFGAAIEDGLVTPVIRNAQTKSIYEISAEVKVLTQKARSKKLSPDEMKGHTFTVTNLGMFGTESFLGIINAPDAGILSVGTTVKKPVIDANGNIVIGHRMNIGFSGDHRVIDGVTGATFLAALKEIIETPALIFI